MPLTPADKKRIASAFAAYEKEMKSYMQTRDYKQMEKVIKKAEAESRFKRHQLVRVCQSPGLSVDLEAETAEGMLTPMPHDHSDPNQHFNSRVICWDTLGRIEIATKIHDNPHCGSWCWSDDMIRVRKGRDWADSSKIKIGQKFTYAWELEGFWGDGHIGKILPCIIEGPHIEPGDWIVTYQKPENGPDGGWITRVLNEKSMTPWRP